MKKEIKVLHIIPDLSQGGAERQLVELISENASHGICQLLPVKLNDFNSDLKLKNIYSLNMKRKVPDIRAISKLKHVIESFKPKIIHTWMYHTSLLESIARILNRNNHISLVWGLRCSNMDVKYYSFQLSIIIKVCKYLSFKPDLIIHNSHSGKKFHDKLGYSNNSIVVSNGIDTERFVPNKKYRTNLRKHYNISEKITVILCVARRDPMKDHKTLISSFQRINNEFSNIILLLAGKDTEYYSKFNNIVGLGVYKNISEVYAASDIIVSSSAFGEGFSNALAEGMSSELVPIATEVGDSREIVGDTGILVPTRNEDALSSAMLEILSLSKKELIIKKQSARMRIKNNFSKIKMLENYSSIYNNLNNGLEN